MQQDAIRHRLFQPSVISSITFIPAKVTSVGIGAVRVGDRVYTCILGEETVEFILADATVY